MRGILLAFCPYYSSRSGLGNGNPRVARLEKIELVDS